MAQDQDRDQDSGAVPDTRLLLALSSLDYPATPGDTYTLAYSLSGAPVTIQVTLDSRYQLKVQHLGTINARGKTYMQLKAEAESLVSRNFPFSGVSLTLRRIGGFSVLAHGEVLNPGSRQVDGLTRVSSFLSNLTARGSIRFVQITAANGAVNVYDVFRAAREGDLSQDPYIRPGDQVLIPPAGRIINLLGEVYRPGRYELLPNETLTELVESYGGGLTTEAAAEKMTISRLMFPTAFTRSVLKPGWDGLHAVAVLDGDEVFIPSKDENRQAVFFEGAVFPPRNNGSPDSAEISSGTESPNSTQDPSPLTNTEGIHRVPYYFYPGETAGSAAARLREIFTELSDLTQAYILRDAERLPLNLELPVFRNDSAGDIHLRGGDVIVIPFRRFYTILGEVAETGSRSITALTRLSALLTDLSAKASTRLAIVSSPGGPEKIYDLFLSRRFGDLSQDPYIRPGDTIRVPAAGRRVSIQGEVFRPGEYELLPGEGLRELVEYYADGFTLAADPEGLDLTRISVSPGQVGEARHISYREQVDFALEDRDQVTVRNKIEKRPRIFFEGALYAAITGDVETTSAGIEGTTLVEYPFFSGETLGNAAYNLRDRFGAVSDLRKAYMIRGQEHIPVDMYQFVYHRDFSKDMVLENGDTIIIPFQQYFVLVSGAVIAPGRYPYVPDRMAEYYINLAGGRDDLLNTGGGIKISDMNNQRLDPGNFIKPETIIEVPTNRLSARINQYAPVISIVLTLISTTLSIFAIMGIFN